MTVCPDCDLLLEAQMPHPGEKLVCPRCGCTLLAPVENSVEKTMVLSLTGLILFPPAIFLPLLTLDILGLESSGSIFTSAKAMVASGFVFTGIAVFFTSMVIPFIKLLLLFLVSMQISLGKANGATTLMFKAYKKMDEWGMLEVYMIGILVTIIKLLHMAKIEYDVGFFCFIGLMGATILSSSFLDENLYWESIFSQASASKTACQKAADKGEKAVHPA